MISHTNPLFKAAAMSHINWFADGLFGLAGLSSLGGFLFHLVTGNPDMAMVYFVGIGGSAAIGWMFSACQQK